jgi:DMSO/TMAO reductase YedYZ molybdopterin-dependent catalytic subunit
MAFNFFRRKLNERERAVADRLPPGQYLTEKWPVLHYGSVPRVDLATWTFSMNGLVNAPVELSREEFMKLPRRCALRHALVDAR